MHERTAFPLMLGIIAIAVFALSACQDPDTSPVPGTPTPDTQPPVAVPLSTFASGDEMLQAFQDAQDQGGYYDGLYRTFGAGVLKTTAVAESVAADSAAPTTDYSTTNVQVQGVDEADIIKTDGTYIYTITNGVLHIIDAYPADDARLLDSVAFDDFYPQELFINGDRLLVFGSATYPVVRDAEPGDVVDSSAKIAMPSIYPPPYYSMMSARLYDISDRTNIDLLETVDFEGNYLTSRMIGDHAYFVVNSYPRWYPEPRICDDIIPLYRQASGAASDEAATEDFQPIARCTNIGYIQPLQAQSFITLASINLENASIQKQVIVGSGENVYASQDSIYIAQTTWPRFDSLGEPAEDYHESTIVTKFALYKGDIVYQGKGEVEGHLLNQFSMDEFDGYFRIATTTGEVWDTNKPSMNNLYVLNSDLEQVGALEDLAPGEKIYSVRFMGERGYVVTFKKVDPLFVIDLADPAQPSILGKLKIPGYSDYLHPIDSTHLIGIGKDAVDAEETLVADRGLDFAWYQGVKMAIFDVSDVEHPVEMYKEVIGDRGTDSPVLHDHKAFLFDKEKGLLVLPITVAEIQGEPTSDNQYGDYVFQGAYVYDVSLDSGFELRGKVTHYDSDEVFKKAGYYFYGDASIQRSLYIGDVLYTLSNARLQLNDLDSLDVLKKLDFPESPQRGEPIVLR